MNKQLNPASTICVIKHDGKEVGRIAATAPNATDYIQTLTQHYKIVSIDHVEDADAAMISRMFAPR